MDKKGQEQIENILKTKADAIEIKPFEERWQDIESKLEFNLGQEEVVEERVPVLATQGSTGNSRNKFNFNNKSKIIIATLCLCITLILAIIIPLSLRKSEPVYFGPNDLIHEFVTEEDFFEDIKNSNIKLVDIKQYKCEEFTLLKSESGVVQGGKFSLNDDENLSIAYITFYSDSVIISNGDFKESEKYELADTEIFYKRTDDGSDLVEYKALAKHNNVTYEIEYMSLNDNIMDFFESFFF